MFASYCHIKMSNLQVKAKPNGLRLLLHSAKYAHQCVLTESHRLGSLLHPHSVARATAWKRETRRRDLL